MATLREIRQRIAGVRSTQKITNAMKMVAVAKLRRAQESIVAARPYARKMNELLRHLAAKVEVPTSPLLERRETRRVLLVVVTADRGLCGPFNSNIVKATLEHVRTHYAERANEPGFLRLLTVGKKGTDFFAKRRYDVVARHAGIFHLLDFHHAQTIAEFIAKCYVNGDFDLVEIVYNEFKSVIQQRVVIEQYLPIRPEELAQDGASRPRSLVDYLYEPSSGEIIRALVPRHLNYQMWRILLESNAAEQGAKMTAMGNATENAKELLRSLTLSYNKARQAGITKELLEIVSGAEALRQAG